MSLKMKLAASFLAVAALAGCAKEPVQTVQTENPEISYSVLFNRQGCEIGRFNDAGRYVYTTICPGGNSSADYTVSNGKTSTHYHNNQVSSPQMDYAR